MIPPKDMIAMCRHCGEDIAPASASSPTDVVWAALDRPQDVCPSSPDQEHHPASRL